MMAKPNALVICFLSFTLCFSACYGTPPVAWCLVKFTDTYDQVKQTVNEICAKWDCHPVLPGGPCFEPNSLWWHASYAMALQYHMTGVCNLDVSVISLKDPSYKDCHYPSSSPSS